MCYSNLTSKIFEFDSVIIQPSSSYVNVLLSQTRVSNYSTRKARACIIFSCFIISIFLQKYLIFYLYYIYLIELNSSQNDHISSFFLIFVDSIRTFESNSSLNRVPKFSIEFEPRLAVFVSARLDYTLIFNIVIFMYVLLRSSIDFKFYLRQHSQEQREEFTTSLIGVEGDASYENRNENRNDRMNTLNTQ